MFDVETQTRFNKSCTEAVVNYLNASGAAYQAMADQMLRMWGQSVDAFVDSAQPPGRSGYTERYVRDERASGANFPMLPWAAVPNAMVGTNPMASLSPFGVPYGMFSPFAPFMEMMNPLQAAAWPMAVGMISVGVPEQIAWPTARGNAAAMDAFNVAANSVEKALKEYKAEPRSRRSVSSIEGGDANPFTLVFAVMPFNPSLMMQFFAPFQSR